MIHRKTPKRSSTAEKVAHAPAKGASAVSRSSVLNPHFPGFTLVELMVVIVILGLLASLVTVAVNDYLVTGKQAVAKTEIAQISNALQLFYTENNRYPSNDEGLAILAEASKNHPGGILQGDLLDPWGHGYVYVYPGLHGTFDILSYGANGQEGGEGADRDIVSWDLDSSAEQG
jgi:general secretion pathway protein G